MGGGLGLLLGDRIAFKESPRFIASWGSGVRACSQEVTL